MRSLDGRLLRAIGRRMFALADVVAPDAISGTLDALYKKREQEELASALEREAVLLRAKSTPFTRKLRSVR